MIFVAYDAFEISRNNLTTFMSKNTQFDIFFNKLGIKTETIIFSIRLIINKNSLFVLKSI